MARFRIDRNAGFAGTGFLLVRGEPKTAGQMGIHINIIERIALSPVVGGEVFL